MISGEKVYLRGLTKESADLIYQWVNDEDLRAYTGTLYPVSEYEHDEWIRQIATAKDRKLFLICDQSNDLPIGTIGLRNMDFINRRAELYISIGNKEYRSLPKGQGGFGTDAVRTLVKYCFDRLNLHKISLNVYEENIRAIKCYEKAGFQKEGLLRDHHFGNGRYENVVVMGIISDR